MGEDKKPLFLFFNKKDKIMTKIQNHYKLQKLLQIHNLQIKQTLFPGTIGVFSWSIQETE